MERVLCCAVLCFDVGDDEFLLCQRRFDFCKEVEYSRPGYVDPDILLTRLKKTVKRLTAAFEASPP